MHKAQTAQNLRRLMEEHGVSENELSRRTKVPQPTIHRILTGASKDPRRSTLVNLAEYFRLTAEDLIYGGGQAPLALTEEEAQLIEELRRDERKRQAILDLLGL